MPGELNVYFDDDGNLADVGARENMEKTLFTKWIEASKCYFEAQELTYLEFPTKWEWNKITKNWGMRKKGDKIGYIYYAHPGNTSTFSSCSMLLKVPRILWILEKWME